MELLSPAGSVEALDAAAGAGADAVYFGLKDFNARVRASNFAYNQAEAAIYALHKQGRKCYITVNTVFEQREADRVYQLLNYLSRIEPDGLIVQDFGIVSLARSYFPSLKIHASTQMNIASARGANALSKFGVSRAVLARELSFDELKEIRINTNVELEVFVHGAICISESGLCLFSSYLGGKSANRGMCAQACRRFYCVEGEADKKGYFFSPADLQLIEKIPLLASAGVNALKIEGRMKSADYVGIVTSAYRTALDALGGSETQVNAALERSKEILRNDFARAKTIFHFSDSFGEENEKNKEKDFLNPDQPGGTGVFLGKILDTRGKEEDYQGFIEGTAGEGDSIRLQSADDSERLSHKITASCEESNGRWISIPRNFGKGDSVFLIQTKAMSRRYPSLISHFFSQKHFFHKPPGFEKAPVIELPRIGKRDAEKEFPEGVYVAVSQTSDLYTLQSARPVKVFLTLNKKNAAHILEEKKPPLPFSAQEIIFSLDPFFPQSRDAEFSRIIPALLEKGYRFFALNNPAHISFFPKKEKNGAVLIAGAYLYTFNRFALSLIQRWGINFFITPLENNRRNLERVFDPRMRDSAFVTVFAYPALFRIRGDLQGGKYGFSRFKDSKDEIFSLISGEYSSFVVPEKPFSLTDKTPFLRTAGFKRFILDFSASSSSFSKNLKKKEYKSIMNAVQSGNPIKNISRFNWKDGFFSSE